MSGCDFPFSSGFLRLKITSSYGSIGAVLMSKRVAEGIMSGSGWWQVRLPSQ